MDHRIAPNRPNRIRIRLAALLWWVVAAGTLLAGNTLAISGPAPTLPPTVVGDLPGQGAAADIPVRVSTPAAVPSPTFDVRLDDPRYAAADWRAERAADRAAAEAAAAAKAQADADARAAAAARAQTAPQTAPKPQAPKPVSAFVYQGTNHFWFPRLGINQPVYSFPCNRTEKPGNVVYRWGCAGANNVYLLAHAGGKFYPLYKAYYAGTLKKGLLTVYADGKGKVHYFKLAWYKVVAPDGDVGFAYAAQSQSSMTLQTCVGSTGQLRLIVRFLEVPKP